MKEKWYAVHTLPQSENKAKAVIEKTSLKYGMSDKIKQIVIPVDTEVKRIQGKKIEKQTTVFPGYMLIQMEMDDESFYDWLFSFFDKIILLDRQDKRLQAESFSYMVHTKNKEWHRKQFYNMSLVPNGFIEEWDYRLDTLKKTLIDLSIKHNKKIYYYEDIFVNKNMETINEIFEYLELEINQDIINEYILSDDRKVRLKEKITKLI